MKQQTKITITLDYSLADLKKAYRLRLGEEGKVTKADIAIMISGLVDADILEILSHDEDDD